MGGACFDMAVCLSGVDLRFYFFSTRFDFGDNPDTGLGFCKSVAFAYRGNRNTTDGYYPTPWKYKKIVRRNGKQNFKALNL